MRDAVVDRHESCDQFCPAMSRAWKDARPLDDEVNRVIVFSVSRLPLGAHALESLLPTVTVLSLVLYRTCVLDQTLGSRSCSPSSLFPPLSTSGGCAGFSQQKPGRELQPHFFPVTNGKTATPTSTISSPFWSLLCRWNVYPTGNLVRDRRDGQGSWSCW